MRLLCFFSAVCVSFFATGQGFKTRFEESKGTQTATYAEVIAWWKKLDAASPQVRMVEAGLTDAGYPLHLVLVANDGDTRFASWKQKNKNVLLIINGIHPGEPDGIDASMLLVRDIVQKKLSLPNHIALAFIPVYNIGGALNRSNHYRVDQNGPENLGFRGNSQNLDLNRDFIKCDSREALTFSRIFHQLQPDILIDNHVSNGADYQHVMSLLTTQHNKLGGPMGAFLTQTFEPALYRLMKEKGYDLVPYVNHFSETPEKGWPQFWDSPRYSSGYATLWNTFAFVPETHMLKPYPQRVAATKALMESFIRFTAENGKDIKRLRREQESRMLQQQQFAVKWMLDTMQFAEIPFKGYETTRKESAVSHLPRLYYDRSKPYSRTIPFYNTYRDTAWMTKPKAYLIPQGWWKVIERLQANGVQMRSLPKDTAIEVESYRIEQYQPAAQPYEGHYPNSRVQVSKRTERKHFRKGDYYITLDQPAARFLLETLEPEAEDSYFAWNFFDAILQQKEGFSDYVFEETAVQFLDDNPGLRKQLEERQRTDSSFARDARAQLNFVYQHSPYYEGAHRSYPVYRVR